MSPEDEEDMDGLLDSLLEDVAKVEKKTAGTVPKPVIVRPPKPVIVRPKKPTPRPSPTPVSSPSIESTPPESSGSALKNIERLRQQSREIKPATTPAPSFSFGGTKPLAKPKAILKGPTKPLAKPKPIPKEPTPSKGGKLEPIRFTPMTSKPLAKAAETSVADRSSEEVSKDPDTVKIKFRPSLRDLVAREEQKKPEPSTDLFEDEYKSVQDIKIEPISTKPSAKKPTEMLETFEGMVEDLKSEEVITPEMGEQKVEMFVETAERAKDAPIFAEEVSSDAVAELEYDKQGYLIPKAPQRECGVVCPKCGHRFEPSEPERNECKKCFYVWYA